MALQKIDVRDLHMNPMTLISDEWMLITAGNQERGYNTMTACWGHMGAIWGHGEGLPTTIIYIRPQRYTKEFIDREEFYTLSFFPKKYKKDLAYLGTHSGRDGDKVSRVGLTPVFGADCTWFEEAKLVLVCRKLYHAPLLEEGFTDFKIVEQNYPERDFHEMYVGKIVEAYLDSEE